MIRIQYFDFSNEINAINLDSIRAREKEMELSAIGERVFAAEALLQRKKFKGKIKYLVKWKGWSSEHNTWEPEENILDQRLLDAFHRKMKQNNSSTAPTTPSSSAKKSHKSTTKSSSNQPSTSNGNNNNSNRDGTDEDDDPKLLSPTSSLSSLSSTDAGSKKKSDTETKTLKRKPSDTVLSNIGLVSTKSLKESSGQTIASTSKSESSKGSNEKESNEHDIKSSSTSPNSSHRSTMNKELKSLTAGTSTSPGAKKTSTVNGTPSNDKANVSSHLTNHINNNNNHDTMSQEVDSTSNSRLNNGTSTPSMNAITPSTPLHQRPMRKSSPPPELWRKQARVAEQILITDVTSNNTTITVRECRTHQGFFKERPLGANPGNRIQPIVHKPNSK